jgi:hypothetical protein
MRTEIRMEIIFLAVYVALGLFGGIISIGESLETEKLHRIYSRMDSVGFVSGLFFWIVAWPVMLLSYLKTVVSHLAR